MRYASEHETPAYKLFHEGFLISIPAAFVRTEEDHRMFGYVPTGDEQYDHELAAAHTRVYRTIPVMAELLESGLNPSELNILKPNQQIPKMLQLINDHIADIDMLKDGKFNQVFIERDMPKELARDLQVLRRFADIIMRKPMDAIEIPVKKSLCPMLEKIGFMTLTSATQTQVKHSPQDRPKVNVSTVSKRGFTRISRW